MRLDSCVSRVTLEHVDNQGSLEIVGHRTGKNKSLTNNSELSPAPAPASASSEKKKKRDGETRGSAAKPDVSAVGTVETAAKGAEYEVLEGSLEDEDGVIMLGDSGKIFAIDRYMATPLRNNL